MQYWPLQIFYLNKNSSLYTAAYWRLSFSSNPELSHFRGYFTLFHINEAFAVNQKYVVVLTDIKRTCATVWKRVIIKSEGIVGILLKKKKNNRKFWIKINGVFSSTMDIENTYNSAKFCFKTLFFITDITDFLKNLNLYWMSDICKLLSYIWEK